jgi:hypothetical protein
VKYLLQPTTLLTPARASSHLEAAALAALIGISILYIYAASALVFAPTHFAFLVSEIGPLESAGALACFVAAGLFLVAFTRSLRSKKYGTAAWHLALALGIAFLALEEISWGQHIFGFGTPPNIAAINAQGETNFHNVRAVHSLSHNLGILILFVFFVVVPLLARFNPVALVFETTRLPIVPLQISALFAYSYALSGALRIVHALAQKPPLNYGEVDEAAYQLIMLLFAVVTAAQAAQDEAPPL